jgi:hypothetical protein
VDSDHSTYTPAHNPCLDLTMSQGGGGADGWSSTCFGLALYQSWCTSNTAWAWQSYGTRTEWKWSSQITPTQVKPPSLLNFLGWSLTKLLGHFRSPNWIKSTVFWRLESVSNFR